MTYDTNSLWHQIKATATDKQSRDRKQNDIALLNITKAIIHLLHHANRKQYPLGRYWGFRYEGVATPHLVSAVPSGSRLHARKRPLFYFTIICTSGSQVKICVYIRIDIKKKGPTINWNFCLFLCVLWHTWTLIFFSLSLSIFIVLDSPCSECLF